MYERRGEDFFHGSGEVLECESPREKYKRHGEHENDNGPLAVQVETPPHGEVGEKEE